MTDDVIIRKAGRAGRITLNRPKALNALTWDMCRAIDAALDAWATDDGVDLVVIDAVGERAFCSGGDISDMYRTASAGDFDYGRRFWAFEYPLNAKVFRFPKPYAAFMHGFTMGGGVGISCHGSHRVVGRTSQIAMPECSIGLIPDVGGTLLLSRAPGRMGEYLGTTGTRMGPADAIYAGFADYFIAEENWPALIERLEATGDWSEIDRAAAEAPAGTLKGLQPDVDRHFAGETSGDIMRSLRAEPGEFSEKTIATLSRQSPISVACTVELIHRIRGSDSIERALEQEFRFAWRSAEMGDFVEGIRAAIIDRDRNPKWRHAAIEDVTILDISNMLRPLGDNALKLVRAT